MFYAYTRSRYQVSVYRTIGPLVYKLRILFTVMYLSGISLRVVVVCFFFLFFVVVFFCCFFFQIKSHKSTSMQTLCQMNLEKPKKQMTHNFSWDSESD